MQEIPDWAEPKVQPYKQENPPNPNCEAVCSPTNPGRAGEVCGCPAGQEIPIGGSWVIILAALGLGAYKLS